MLEFIGFHEQGEEYGAVLMLKVSDMGNYGCYSDCAKKMSTPLFAEAYVNLVRRRPMTSLVAHGKLIQKLVDLNFFFFPKVTLSL